MKPLGVIRRGVSLPALALGLLLATPSQAESTGQLRLGAGLKYKLIDELKVVGGTELRLVTGPDQFDSVLPNIRLKYQLFNHLAISIGYRFKYQSDEDDTFE